MAEAGSFAEKVKQQADIVRIVGEYVRLKKSGQNFTGLCPFHSEKTPSFAVHPTKQIYHCFGCGVGGDVFQFVMEMDKCAFPEAVRVVAEKCGIPIPRPREHSPGERRENQQRTALIEMHREAAAFFVRQLEGTPEGKVARAYLEDRGLDAETIARFELGFAPSGGEVLYRHLKQKYPDQLIDVSGLVSRDQSGGRLFDRFRRRIMFPIANEGGKIVAFGGRALGDDLPKYLNSSETPIYSKSNVLYHLDRAKESLRRADFAILVEGYMDTIGVVRVGIGNVVASCGTSLSEPQVKLLGRFTRRVVVNYDPDAAGQAATERSIGLLLEQGFDVRVLALPGKADPDKFIREQGKNAYQKLLDAAPEYVDYLIDRARKMDLTTGEGKLRAVNFLMPYVQRIPNRLLRSEWASRIAQQLRVEEPVLRESLRRAAAERRGEVKTQPALLGRVGKQAERRLIQMLNEAEGFRERLAEELRAGNLYHGLETEKIFAALLEASSGAGTPDPVALAGVLPENDRRLLFEVLFEAGAEATWEEAESCLVALRLQRARKDLNAAQLEIETKAAKEASASETTGTSGTSPDLHKQMARKQELNLKREELDALEEDLERRRKEKRPNDMREIDALIEDSLRRIYGPDH